MVRGAKFGRWPDPQRAGGSLIPSIRVLDDGGSGALDHVELAMVLAVDGSASVTYDEFGLIAGGMAVALRDPTVAARPDRDECAVVVVVVGRRTAGRDHRLDPDLYRG